MDAHRSAERFDTMALYDQLEAVLAETLAERAPVLERLARP
jgi:hypothetical protein